MNDPKAYRKNWEHLTGNDFCSPQEKLGSVVFWQESVTLDINFRRVPVLALCGIRISWASKEGRSALAHCLVGKEMDSGALGCDNILALPTLGEELLAHLSSTSVNSSPS